MNIEHFLVELLHIEDITGNRLLDLDGDGTAKTYYLYGQEESRHLGDSCFPCLCGACAQSPDAAF